MNKIKTLLIWVYGFICCIIFVAGYFYACSQVMYQNYSVHQFIFHIATLSTDNFSKKVIGTILVPFSLSVVFVLLVFKKPLLWLRYYVNEKYITYWSQRKRLLSFITSTITAVAGVLIAVGISDVPGRQMVEETKYALSLLYNPPPYDSITDDYFANPAEIEFKQKQPQNLIIIFAESLERTFLDEDLLGQNLLPNLQEQTGVSVFGYKKLSEIDWTEASIIASLCGVTSKQYLPQRKLSKDFICISDVLNRFGYNVYSLRGSSLRFAAGEKFLSEHGFTENVGIEDIEKSFSYQLAPTKLYSDKLYDVNFIGDVLDDSDLLKIFREKIEHLAQENKPFMAIAATMNTHPFHGYVSRNCQRKYKDMRDAIMCSDRQLASFVKWFKAQNFAENTTLVIMGDHLMMYNDIQAYLDKASRRETLNLIWGSAAPEKDIHKPFNQFDWAPTLLEMAGVYWDGHKFALGTSLLSEEKTLQEQFGDDLNPRLLRSSKIYETLVFK